MENVNSTLTMAIAKNQICEIAPKMTIQESKLNGKLQGGEQKIEIAKFQFKRQ
jgi:hypothetical protein